ncbi:class I SAM-dependent methyltransferase [Microlunatus sp. GCM10028923]|uniref:class I SAM-dependent methyltransferase n=1 Tax=Microlunatus sp. GCM10028923 TaxID=3273400 RepID=UPI00360880A4
MTEDPYRDEQLVQLYDVDNPPGDDHEYFRGVAGRTGATKIIDFGCGTGLLTRALVTDGRTVIGVDPSPTMLGYARRQPGADAVTWIDGDAAAVQPAGDADLVISSGNAMMHVAPDDYPGVLAALAAALRPGGVITFDSRNPAARAWEQWQREATYGERDTPFGRLREWLELVGVENGRVEFDAYNVFADGRTEVLTSVLYFREPGDLVADLEAAGFTDVDVRGGWHGEPVGPDTRVLVITARRG